MALSNEIRQFAKNKVEFDLVGFSPASLPMKFKRTYLEWVERDFEGEMSYMKRKERMEATGVLKNARSVISLGLNYYYPLAIEKEDGYGYVSRYAWGRDYHKIIRKKLKLLSDFIVKRTGAEVKLYVDTGPILERAYAYQSGIGFFGKNSNLISPIYGSWIFLASAITNLELEYDMPLDITCGRCKKCIDACPTNAIVSPYIIDSRRCISYLTIELRKDIPREFHKKVGRWIFGCDICQDVCPFNKKFSSKTRTEGFFPRKNGNLIDIDEVLKMDYKKFLEKFKGTSIIRSKLNGLKRTARIIKLNEKAY